MNNDCIFCKIVAGKLPSVKVYEDSQVLAFMDIGPVSKGHVLVIPKSHHDPITETPDEVLQQLIVIVRKVARAQKEGLQADGINVAQANGECAGQLVPHIHFHLIPRFDRDPNPRNWIPSQYEHQTEIESYAEKIRNAL